MKPRSDIAVIASRMRGALRVVNIPVKVKAWNTRTVPSITVAVRSYESRFTPEQIKLICEIAVDMKLSFVQGIKIDPESETQLTEKLQWEFYVTKDTEV